MTKNKRVTSLLVYRAMKEFYVQNGCPPSVRELGEIIGIPTSSVQRHILILKKIGWIAGEPHKHRKLKFRKDNPGDVT
ncbi:LexA family protein [Desulfolucanica intricata]|uniref:LexA family protein n=1 Tax=Desulfolucanica intricata TaxID=1285191 RepID=UPI0008299941|nr:hypothetical protein [Desulfolucanica intricata]